MALDVENLIPNSCAASLIVDYLVNTLLRKAILIAGGMMAYLLDASRLGEIGG